MELPSDLEPPILEGLARDHGTPLYVTSAETIRRRYRELRNAFPDARVQYAAKANTNVRILEILRDLGASLDAVSLGEVIAAEKAGFESERVMYTGVCPSEEELREVLGRNILVNADSLSDIEKISKIAPGREIGIRVNPEIGAGHHRKVITGGEGSKFGVPESRIMEAYERAQESLNPVGIHMHIGSGILEPDPLLEAVRNLDSIVDGIENAGIELEYVDIGGGLGVPYRPDQSGIDLEKLAKGVRDNLETDAKLVVEPGRFLVAESTVLLTRVTTLKDGFVGVDAGFNTLLRPAMYDAYHHISNLTRPQAQDREVTVVGPICESGDVLARDRRIPDPHEGDLLAVHTAGAYGFTMASRYNSRPLPAEVLVDGASTDLIRERETYDDLFEKVRFE
ncbi:MAG: diaminopimelate decarboxylase [Halobacteria archaeon]|nr:diaminopimelate decarboxylase [Halobacteria archaeon]